MFPDDFFAASYFANDYYPPDESAAGGHVPVAPGSYVLWAPWRLRHRVVT